MLQHAEFEHMFQLLRAAIPFKRSSKASIIAIIDIIPIKLTSAFEAETLDTIAWLASRNIKM